jgi:hypothetical protein
MGWGRDKSEVGTGSTGSEVEESEVESKKEKVE